jgi:hypothetical protein
MGDNRHQGVHLTFHSGTNIELMHFYSATRQGTGNGQRATAVRPGVICNHLEPAPSEDGGTRTPEREGKRS